MTRTTNSAYYYSGHASKETWRFGNLQSTYVSNPYNYLYFRDKSSRSDIVRNEVVQHMVGDTLVPWRFPSPYSAVFEDMGSIRMLDKSYTEDNGYGNMYYKSDLELEILLRAPVPLDPPQWMIDKTVTYARLKAADKEAAFATSIAEFPSTIAGLRRNAQSLINWEKALRDENLDRALASINISRNDARGRRASANIKRILKRTPIGTAAGLGAAWLNYNFGIKPIIDDMVNLMKFLDDHEKLRPIIINGVARHVIRDSIPEVNRTLNPAQYPYSLSGNGTFSYSIRSKQERFARTSLWYALDMVDRLENFSSFGGDDFLSGAWSAVPFSFVVDWVIPVNAVLKSISGTEHLKYISGTTTTKSSSKVSIGGGKLVSSIPGVLHQNGSGMSHSPGSRMAMNRIIYQTEPVPGIWVKDPFQVYQAQATLSLLATSLKR